MLTRNANIDELAREPLGRLILKYSWPALVAMTLNALYAVIDRFYIGQGCGEAAMAGITLTFPIMMLFGAFGVFVGAGHAALLSIKLGENDFVSCEKLIGQLVAIKLFFFLVLSPLVFFNADAILSWCGGSKVSPEAFAAARTYLRIIVFSHLFSHLAFGLSATTRAEGGAVKSMMSLVVGFGANLLLDPLLIFGLPTPSFLTSYGSHLIQPRGVAGAAWATNIAMFLSFAWAVRYYFTGQTVVRLRWRYIGFYRAFIGRTAAIGFAPFLQHLLGSLINVSLAAAFGKWATSQAEATTQIASLGVFQSVMILTLMPVFGVQQGLQPIFGYNWGARNFKRVKETLWIGFGVTSALCVLACLVQVVPPFPTYLARLFVSSDNPALISIAAHDLTVSNCMIWSIGINVLATTYYQSIGHPGAAIFLSTLRQGVILIPCIWILPNLMKNPVLAIWLALPLSDVICQLATIVPLWLSNRFLSRVREKRC